MRAHHRLIKLNRADLKVYNTANATVTSVLTGHDIYGRETAKTIRSGTRIIARLQHGGVTYFGDGPTVDAALAALDADIEGAANDCDCVLPEHTCSTCCPKEVNLKEIPF